jgi:hypothetical protein
MEPRTCSGARLTECFPVHTDDLDDNRPFHAAAPLTPNPPFGGTLTTGTLRNGALITIVFVVNRVGRLIVKPKGMS